MGMFGVRACALVTVALAFSGLWYRVRATESDQKQVAAADCTFVPNPDEFLGREARVRRDLAERVFKLDRAFPRAAVAAASRGAERALALPQRNFIDAEIFGKLARLNVPPARLSTDEEFFRRINLDLTGRIPSPDDIKAFVADTSA